MELLVIFLVYLRILIITIRSLREALKFEKFTLVMFHIGIVVVLTTFVGLIQ